MDLWAHSPDGAVKESFQSLSLSLLYWISDGVYGSSSMSMSSSYEEELDEIDMLT